MASFPAPTPRASNTLALLLCAGALGAAVYLAIALSHGDDGSAAIPQLDTLIYEQYARAIAEGHAYRFMPGDAPSTGSTSHLLPWILAAFYRLGATGDALGTAGLAFDGVCWLVFLGMFFVGARRMAPGAAPLGAALVALSGHALFAVFGQTDQSLFMALSACAFAAAMCGRHVLLAIALALCVWARPEGAVLAAALLIAAALPRAGGGESEQARTDAEGGNGRLSLLGAALFACAAFAAQLYLNHRLTGAAFFQSLGGKGLSADLSLAAAARKLAGNLGLFWREAFLGLGSLGREFYAIPVVGGLLALIGLASRLRRAGGPRRAEIWWLLGLGGSVTVIAMSPTPDLFHDRYFSWILPYWLLLSAMGARVVTERLPWRGAGGLLAGVLLVWQAVGFIYFAGAYAESCAATASNVRFARKCNGLLPAGSRVGYPGGAGMGYVLDKHTTVNIYGVMTPDFINPGNAVGNFEILKHKPGLRFDAWFTGVGTSLDVRFAPFLGEQLAAEAPLFGSSRAMTLHRTNWSPFDGAADPVSTATLEAVKGLRQIGRVDVGYWEDEKAANYDTYTRVPGTKLLPFMAVYTVGGRRIADVGRAIYGSESFRAKVEPGRPLKLVLRTASFAQAPIGDKLQNFSFGSPLTLRLFVGDRELEPFAIEIPKAEDQFSEAVLEIPAAALTSESAEFTVGGDHLSFAYWWYQ